MTARDTYFEALADAHATYGPNLADMPVSVCSRLGDLYQMAAKERTTPDACPHRESVLTPDGNGAYCKHCGETTA